MEILRTVAAMTDWSEKKRLQGMTIGLVPTMGFFHQGHLHLMRLCRQQMDHLVVSLFVNPIQFAPGEDLAAYPRDLDRDAALAAAEGTEVLFAPDNVAMYPPGFQTRVLVGSLTETLCGAGRPGHFAGVTTVVTKLLHIIRPHCAVFGEKDYQQLVVIRRLVADLNLDVRILSHDIVREPDGLAMSSRNTYLSTTQRRSALCLYKSLQLARRRVAEGVLAAATLKSEIEQYLATFPEVSVEYVSIVDQESLQDKTKVDETVRLAMAVRVGSTRLIDNGRLC
jgi:pantoate--beta-alanine ligase